MGEKNTAIYLMVRYDELKPEDNGSYERPLAEQKEACLSFLREKLGGESEEGVKLYTSRAQLVKDIEMETIKRLVVLEQNRLGGNALEIEGFLFELEMSGVELLSVRE